MKWEIFIISTVMNMKNSRKRALKDQRDLDELADFLERKELS